MKRMGVACCLLLTLVLSACPLRAQQTTTSTSAPPASASSAEASQAINDKLSDLDKRVAAAQSSADNGWMLVSAALVLMMTGPGLALSRARQWH